MKKMMIDLIIACALIALLVVLAIASRSQAEAQETFSPPSVGVGRESETEAEVIIVTDIETETAIETEMETEIETEVETQLETEAVTEVVTETVTESEAEPEIIEVIEVIPAIEGKYLDVPMSAELQDYVRAVSADYGIPFELTMAVIYVESGFDSSAISSTGDYGLMQISYVNHEWLKGELGVEDFLDPYENILGGVYILKDKIRESGGDFTIALMRYNRGNAVALQQMSQGIFSTPYTEKVLSKYYEYIIEG